MPVVLLVAALTFALDQVSKYLVVRVMNLRELYAIDVLPPVLNFRMAWNYGINFGLFSQDSPITRWLLIAIALAITVAVLVWMTRAPGTRWQRISAGLLVGGALGNVVDRLIYGAVADFLNMSCCGIDNPFAFNVADVAVFAGAIGLMLFSPAKNPA